MLWQEMVKCFKNGSAVLEGSVVQQSSYECPDKLCHTTSVEINLFVDGAYFFIIAVGYVNYHSVWNDRYYQIHKQTNTWNFHQAFMHTPGYLVQGV